MEFKANQSELLRELALIQGIVETRATIPVLSNLLLRARKDGIEIVATDLQVGLRTSCPARVAREGGATVSAKRLFEIVRSLPDSDIEFKTPDSGSIQISCKDSRFKLQTLPPDDFPALPETDFKSAVDLPREAFQDMIERVLFAVTREDNRFALNGALLLLQPESMTLIATDGHRLALVRRRQAFKGIREEKRVLIPKKALAELVRFRKPFEEDVPPEDAKLAKGKKKTEKEKEAGGEMIRFSTDQNHLLFEADHRLLISRVLEGSFPNYERVIPDGNDRLVSVGREALLETVRRVLLLSYEKSRAVRMQFSKGTLVVSAQTPQVGEAEEPVAISYDGPAIEMGFNGDYVLDWLSHVGTADVQIALRDSETQGLFTPKGDVPFEYQYIIMPMRL